MTEFGAKHNGLNDHYSQQIKDLNLGGVEVPEDIKDVTVQDLNDLALRLAKLPVHNERVKNMPTKQIQEIEDVFKNFKGNVEAQVQSRGLEAADVSVSCCCCTPCCSCAATDLSHTA